MQHIYSILPNCPYTHMHKCSQAYPHSYSNTHTCTCKRTYTESDIKIKTSLKTKYCCPQTSDPYFQAS